MTDLLVKYRALTPDEQLARRLAKLAQPVTKRTNATEPGSRARRIVVYTVLAYAVIVGLIDQLARG